MNVDDLYNKYIVEFIIEEKNWYAIWGTDMSDLDKPDKFLIVDGKLLLLSDKNNFKRKINFYQYAFFDQTNFSNWLNNKNPEILSASFRLDYLTKYNGVKILEKEYALDFLDLINILKDLFNQINNKIILPLFENGEIALLLDQIYNSFFWRNSDGERKKKENFRKIDIGLLKDELFRIYDSFIENIITV